MTTTKSPKFQELVTKLREIFQIDRPELDFGIYRILNARAGEINDYLENRLAEKVEAALTEGNTVQREQLARELKEKEDQYRADGINPDSVPKIKNLREELAKYNTGATEHENAVFSHLLTFFSRYYDQGDFISQRRYKGDTYAIPYAGEEVTLYWANKDQYYTKSGENFANYNFKLEDGRTIQFKLVAADTAKDNRKDNDKERRFALIEKQTVTRIGEEGDEYEEELLPIEEVTGDSSKQLVIRFEYAPQAKGTKQEALVTKAVERILADTAVKAHWLALSQRAPTEKNPQRTLLEKYLTDYTTKNTADYFIHKDLGGFLRRELDFYIKNEVMHLDDVQNAGVIADIERNLRMIQCLRAIALELISFLAQLEDFQKKLWLKKKFVVSSDYCITLDRVPEALYPEIVANERQWVQWKQLAMWETDSAGAVEDLKSGCHRMVDTALFPAEFKNKLLSTLSDIDASCNGLLIHGDNFQGLLLLEYTHKNLIKCVYIDPPYNTSEATFIYKNQYKHSSWLSMMDGRVEKALDLMSGDGILQITIDDEELYRLKGQLDTLLGQERYIGTIVIQSNPRGRGINSFFATSHDYAVAYAKDPGKAVICDEPLTEEGEEGYGFSDEISEYRLLPFRRSGGLSTPVDRPNSEFSLLLDPKSLKIIAVGGPRIFDYPEKYAAQYALTLQGGEVIENDYEDFREQTSCVEVLPVDSDGGRRVWRWSDRKKILEHAEAGEFVVKRKDGSGVSIQLKDRIKDGRKPKTIWTDSKFDASSHGTILLSHLFGDRKVFGYPKSIHSTLASISTVVRSFPNSTVLDCFAGSGTTGHATIALNRADGGTRRYVLIEQGDYFDTVTKPRMMKVVYSAEWKDGSPAAPDTGISHCFKVLKLESYEDTLNNLQLRRADAQGELLTKLPKHAKDDYLMHYMLDVESRGSLLSVEDFRKPFDYSLNIAIDSAGTYERRKIDLVETFNYLIGLRVKHIDAQVERGFVTVTGTLPSGETCLVLWRDCDKWSFDAYEGKGVRSVTELCDKLAINPKDNEFDVVYINGDHNIPTVLTLTDEEGGASRVLKLRQIEPEFLQRMFSVEDV